MPESDPSSRDRPDPAPDQLSISPLRCFSGAFVSGTLAVLAYRLMTAIAITFANKPILSDNTTTMRIASAVRTLVVGSVALAAGVFGFAALGLFALGLQLIWQRLFSSAPTTK